MLHAILRKAFKDSEGNVTEAGRKLIDAFKNTLSERELKYIDAQINANYKKTKNRCDKDEQKNYMLWNSRIAIINRLPNEKRTKNTLIKLQDITNYLQ